MVGDFEQQSRNARLIAKAPELLDACFEASRLLAHIEVESPVVFPEVGVLGPRLDRLIREATDDDWLVDREGDGSRETL